MLIRFFLNEPNGNAWTNFLGMMSSLGTKYDVNIEIISKPRADYRTDAYFELDLPVAPAIMVDEEILMEGGNISQGEVEACICRKLGIVVPEW